MSMQRLIKKLKEQESADHVDVSQQRDEWLEAIEALYKRIESWLSQGVQEGGSFASWRANTRGEFRCEKSLICGTAAAPCKNPR